MSGRVPDSYWGPGCVPCRTAKPEWALPKNGYQEPPTGPTNVTGRAIGGEGTGGSLTVTVTVSGGPEESVSGNMELRMAGRSSNLMGWAQFDGDGIAEFKVPSESFRNGTGWLVVHYFGSDRLKPGRATIKVQAQG